ncbi:PREDICTED: interferon-inducible double-stranded RNA-dependent protein kinase activator A homolog [Ceratosolen solmsi marchali]|uniref:Interferon-inducible double-stranded RNA-dependent protein kinase activator A homolog n=1 Tax=Ceratosolen solmsi marchali TaxID=326594 RepID=A0AAJ7DY32_9HYME|nr:PREDICTED: interferon-inducible double-stranded RNA-dependent protein kinase activator A homolog [Ceratosolen solmsi marchali]
MVSNVVPNQTNGVRRRKAKVTMHTLISETLPLDVAARLEMKALPNKTPVSILQELLSRRGTTPTYELVQIEGAIHEPTFCYRVTVADVVAMGTGKSKKEAKHNAAKSVLDKLIAVNNENTEAPVQNSTPDYSEEKVVSNPIGSLQELCMSYHWPPPKYSMEDEEGLPHERQYTIVCSILKHRQFGQGKSKKLAKRQAAHKMWQSLQENNVDEDEVAPKNTNVSPHYANLKDSKIATLTTTHGIKVSQFHKNLKSATGDKLFELQNTCLNDGDVNLVQFLQDIASEQQFEVTYVDIEEKSISGKYQCLVQLSTLPVAVCYGSDVSSKDAQAAAAQNALEYLKIMTKK